VTSPADAHYAFEDELKALQPSRSLDYYLRQPIQVARAHPNIMTPRSPSYSVAAD
jgi:hypothetical protein